MCLATWREISTDGLIIIVNTWCSMGVFREGDDVEYYHIRTVQFVTRSGFFPKYSVQYPLLYVYIYIYTCYAHGHLSEFIVL